jgi:hypothetical protein
MNEPTHELQPSLTLLQRREIEAAIVGPLVRAFAARFGDRPVRETLAEVIRDLARQRGESLTCELGSNDLQAFASTIETWKAGGALELELLRSDGEQLNFDVKRCRFAEMYRRLGLEDLGPILSCLRDFELVAGFDENIELERTQTLMEGASHCDFRFRKLNQNEHEKP